MENEALVTLTADIVAAHVSHNNVAVGEVGRLVQQVHGALSSLGRVSEEPQAKVPVVSARASVKPDHLVCMECGKNQTMLKRHLQTAHGMSPEDYRRDYGLPNSYPMIAPEYAEKRRDIAKAIGLGRKKGEKVGPRRGRKPKAGNGNGNGGATAS